MKKVKNLLYKKNQSKDVLELSLLGGLVYFMKDFSSHAKTLKLGKMTVLEMERQATHRCVVLGKKLKFQFRRNIPLLNKILKQIGPGYDDIYICKHHIGEIYVFCQLLKEYIKSNGSQKPILIVPQARYVSLYKMFVPDVPMQQVDLDLGRLDGQVLSAVTLYKGHRFFIPVPDRFVELRKFIFSDGKDIHFADYLAQQMNATSCARYHAALITENTQQRVEKYAEKLGLNLDKFVIFSPEAITSMDLSHTFWINLGKFMKERGYQVFVNTVTWRYPSWMDKIPNAIKGCPSFDEFYYMSSRAAAVIALVNGLVVTLAQVQKPRFFLYTNQNPTLGDRMDADTILRAYRLDKMPDSYVSNLHEISLNEMCEKDVLKMIASSEYFQEK